MKKKLEHVVDKDSYAVISFRYVRLLNKLEPKLEYEVDKSKTSLRSCFTKAFDIWNNADKKELQDIKFISIVDGPRRIIFDTFYRKV